jgi:hypothetical protein
MLGCATKGIHFDTILVTEVVILLEFANIFYTSLVFRNRLAYPSSSVTKIINKQ